MRRIHLLLRVRDSPVHVRSTVFAPITSLPKSLGTKRTGRVVVLSETMDFRVVTPRRFSA